MGKIIQPPIKLGIVVDRLALQSIAQQRFVLVLHLSREAKTYLVFEPHSDDGDLPPQ